MIRSLLSVVVVLVGTLSASTGSPGRALAASHPPNVRSASTVGRHYGSLPLSFEPNRGQAPAAVRFLVHGGGYTLFITESGAVLSLPAMSAVAAERHPSLPYRPARQTPRAASAVLRLHFAGAALHPLITAGRRLHGVVNYLIGNNPHRWHTGIPTYDGVTVHGLYRGVDLVYHGSGGRLEYDYRLTVGADPRAIRLQVTGAHGLHLDARGDLHIEIGGREVLQHRPVVYQGDATGRVPVAARYALASGGRVGVVLGRYDRARPLVIDPLLTYSSYLGGNGSDTGNSIAVDGGGNAYVAGTTASTDFPLCPNSDGAAPCSNDTNATLQGGNRGNTDAFVAKVDASGTFLWYSTYLGGSGPDAGNAIVVDSNSNAWIAGNTASADFPTVNKTQGLSSTHSAFVSELTPDGTALAFSSYYGFSTDTFGTAIGLTENGNVELAGYYVDQPSNVLQGYVTEFLSNHTAVPLVKFDYPAGGDSVFTALVAGEIRLFIAGYGRSSPGVTHGFVARIEDDIWGCGCFTTITSLALGTTGTTEVTAMADGVSGLYVTGFTDSTGFQTIHAKYDHLGGGYDAFLVQWNGDTNGETYGTYFGGTGNDYGTGVAVDPAGNVYFTGFTRSTDFPLQHASQDTFGGGYDDAFCVELSRMTSDPQVGYVNPIVTYSTYLGGTGSDAANAIAVDANGTAYLTGTTSSSDFPTVGPFQRFNYGSGDAFVSRLVRTPTHFAVDPFQTSVAAGTQFSFEVTALDDAGQRTPLYPGTIALSTTDPSGTAPASYTFSPADSGIAILHATLRTPGTWTIAAHDTSDPTVKGTSGPIGVAIPPVIASISPTTWPVNGGAFTLTVSGSHFTTYSTVRWNGTVLPTSLTSPSTLSAGVPASDVTTSGAAEITVATYGIVSNIKLLYVNQQSTTVTGSSSGSSASASGSAQASVGGTGPGTTGSSTATATGAGTVTVAQYSSNPGTTTGFTSPAGFFDVHLSSGNTFTGVTIVDCNLSGATAVYWYNGTGWALASKQSYNASTHCVTVTVNSTTTPTLKDLGGTPFAAGNVSPTVARVSNLSARQHGSSVVVRWRLVRRGGLVAFHLQSGGGGKGRVHFVRLHTLSAYHVRLRWYGERRYMLWGMLANGQRLSLAAVDIPRRARA